MECRQGLSGDSHVKLQNCSHSRKSARPKEGAAYILGCLLTMSHDTQSSLGKCCLTNLDAPFILFIYLEQLYPAYPEFGLKVVMYTMLCT